MGYVLGISCKKPNKEGLKGRFMKRTLSVLGTLGLLGVVAVATTPSSSEAFFTYQEPRQAMDSAAPAVAALAGAQLPIAAEKFRADGPVVIQAGTGTAAQVASFGDDLDMSVGLPLILPAGWTYSVVDGSNLEDFKGSWHSKGSWVDALKDVGHQSGLHFLVDWNTRTVFVAKAANDLPMPSAVTGKEIPLVDGAAVSAPVVKPVWELHPGSLKEQLTGWAKTAEYQLIWSSPNDIQIQANGSLQGEFVEVVQTVSQRLFEQGAKIRVHIYQGNKVVLVKGE